MPSKIEIALQSPAFWSIALIGLSAGISAIIPSLQGIPLEVATVVLAVIAAYAHPTEVQNAGNTK